jgi:hypothetical protein
MVLMRGLLVLYKYGEVAFRNFGVDRDTILNILNAQQINHFKIGGSNKT